MSARRSGSAAAVSGDCYTDSSGNRGCGSHDASVFETRSLSDSGNGDGGARAARQREHYYSEKIYFN